MNSRPFVCSRIVRVLAVFAFAACVGKAMAVDGVEDPAIAASPDLSESSQPENGISASDLEAMRAELGHVNDAVLEAQRMIEGVGTVVSANQNIQKIDEKFLTELSGGVRADLLKAIEELKTANAENARLIKEALQKLPTKPELLNAVAVGSSPVDKSDSLGVRTAMIGVVSSIFAALATLIALIILLRLRSMQMDMPHAVASTSPAPQNASSGSNAAYARIEERISSLASAISQSRAAPVDSGKPQSNTELLGRLDLIEAAIKRIAQAPAQAPAGPKEDFAPVADSFWPKGIKGFEGYPVWRKAMVDALASGRAEAMLLASTLFEYQTTAGRRDLEQEKFCELVTRLSQNLYRYCYALDGVADEDRLDLVSAILRQVKEDAQSFTGLEVRAFFPNDRLNTDLMEKMDSGSRLTVNRPLSWLVMDRSPGNERVLKRAMVVTG